MSLQVPPRCIFVPLTHIPLFLALVNLIPFTSAVSCHVFFIPVLAKRPSYNNMYAKVFHKIILSFKMLVDINCNENVKYTSLNSCWVCHLQNHCLKYWFCKRPLVLSGGRNANGVKETEWYKQKLGQGLLCDRWRWK